jgi:hypothetical protein
MTSRSFGQFCRHSPFATLKNTIALVLPNKHKILDPFPCKTVTLFIDLPLNYFFIDSQWIIKLLCSSRSLETRIIKAFKHVQAKLGCFVK